jgi:hypothetical protein
MLIKVDLFWSWALLVGPTPFCVRIWEGCIRHFGSLLLVCVISALVSVAAIFGMQAWKATSPIALKDAKPGAAYIESYKCARGQNKIVLLGGVEDGFDTGNVEPARLNPNSLPNPYMETLRDATSGMVTLRDYDEGGQDKLLVDYFDVPRGITAAQIVLVQKANGDQKFDSLNFGDFAKPHRDRDTIPYVGTLAFSYSIGSNKLPPVKQDPITGLLVLNMAIPAFVSGAVNDGITAPRGNVLDYLNSPDRPDQLEIRIADDTAVDFVALVLCQIPPVAMGTTFAEFSIKPFGPSFSHLTCNHDDSQAPCNPFQGDQLCTQALPVACYKPSPAPAPVIKGVGGTSSGEVRPTAPVAGNQFPNLASANAFCVRQFGDGWRVLSYHDGGLGAIATKSTKPGFGLMCVINNMPIVGTAIR